MSRRLLAVAAAAALTVGLTACGDGGDGTRTDPPPSIDIAQSDGGGEAGEGSTEAAPDIPAPDPADYPGMDEQTAEGAEQAFKYFWDVAIVGYMTGDPGVLAELSDPSCANCESMRAEIEELGVSGGHWGETKVEPDSISSGEGSDGFDMFVDYSIVIGEHQEISFEGGGKELVDESILRASGGLLWVDGRWLVADFDSRSSEKGE